MENFSKCQNKRHPNFSIEAKQFIPIEEAQPDDGPANQTLKKGALRWCGKTGA